MLVRALVVLLLVTALVSSAVGSVPISVIEIGSLLASKVGLATSVTTTETQASVLFAIRLPRIVLGVLVGSSLGLSGAAMQGVFRNPLVDPGLLGVSSGAALGAVTAIVLGAKLAHGIPAGLSAWLLPIAAFGGALAAMSAVQGVSRFDGRTAVTTLLLAGIAINALSGALTGFLTFVATDVQVRTITFWSLGSLGGATWPTVLASLPFIGLPLVLLPRFGRSLNVLALGEAEAGHLGFDVERLKLLVVGLAALAVGASVAVAGVLGFVGLVVPHVVRLIGGPDHRSLLPSAALLGASLLLAADVVARTVVAPAEVPLGILTAALGTPFFLALLLRERRRLA